MGERGRIPPWLKQLPLAPVYYPTEEEFCDPIGYISKIEKEASKYGICKIVPPVPKPSKKQVFSNLNKYLVDLQDLAVAGAHGTSPACVSRSMGSIPKECPNYGAGGDNGCRVNDTDNDASDSGVATFTTRLQQIGWNLKKPKNAMPFVVQKPVWQTGESYTLDEFEAKARAFYRCRLGTSREVPSLIIENMFWKAESDKPIFVEYANDIPGTAFGEPNPIWTSSAAGDTRKEETVNEARINCYNSNLGVYGKAPSEEDSGTKGLEFENVCRQVCDEPSNGGLCVKKSLANREFDDGADKTKGNKRRLEGSGRGSSGVLKNIEDTAWNMRIVARLPGSVIRHMPDEVPGVTSPMVYIGMLFSWFAWHVEDHELHSLNYLHLGFSKTWYAVPGYAARYLEDLIRVRGYGDHLNPLASFGILGEKTTVISPEVLVEAGIPCCRLVQNPGEFVVTFPRAYHLGFSHGFNCGEAANFATPAWLKVAKEAAVRRAAMNHLPMLSHQQLLYIFTLAFPSRVPLSLADKPENSSNAIADFDREKEVKKCFVDDMLNNNYLLDVLLRKKSTCYAVLWDSALIPDDSSTCVSLLENTKHTSISTSQGLEAMPTLPASKRISIFYKKRRHCAPVTSERVNVMVDSEKLFSSAADHSCQINENADIAVSHMDVSHSEAGMRSSSPEKNSSFEDFVQLNSGSLACVACGVLGFPCMAVIQISSEAADNLKTTANYVADRRFEIPGSVFVGESSDGQEMLFASSPSAHTDIFNNVGNKFVIRRKDQQVISEFEPSQTRCIEKATASNAQSLRFTIKRASGESNFCISHPSTDKSEELDTSHDSDCRKEHRGFSLNNGNATLYGDLGESYDVKSLDKQKLLDKSCREISMTEHGSQVSSHSKDTNVVVSATNSCQHVKELSALDLLVAAYNHASESESMYSAQGSDRSESNSEQPMQICDGLDTAQSMDSAQGSDMSESNSEQPMQICDGLDTAQSMDSAQGSDRSELNPEQPMQICDGLDTAQSMDSAQGSGRSEINHEQPMQISDVLDTVQTERVVDTNDFGVTNQSENTPGISLSSCKTAAKQCLMQLTDNRNCNLHNDILEQESDSKVTMFCCENCPQKIDGDFANICKCQSVSSFGSPSLEHKGASEQGMKESVNPAIAAFVNDMLPNVIQEHTEANRQEISVDIPSEIGPRCNSNAAAYVKDDITKRISCEQDTLLSIQNETAKCSSPLKELASVKEYNISSLWKPCKGFMRPHVFCLEHALQVEEQLSSLGGAQLLLICHAEYPKIERRAELFAKELGIDCTWKDIPLKHAVLDDLQLIDVAIEEQSDADLGSDWTAQLGFSLRYGVKCSRSLYSKQMPDNKVLDSLFHTAFDIDKLCSISYATDFSELTWKSKSQRGRRNSKQFIKKNLTKFRRTGMRREAVEDNHCIPDKGTSCDMHQCNFHEGNTGCVIVKRPRGRPRKIKNTDSEINVSENINTKEVISEEVLTSLTSTPRPAITKTFYRKRRKDMGVKVCGSENNAQKSAGIVSETCSQTIVYSDGSLIMKSDPSLVNKIIVQESNGNYEKVKYLNHQNLDNCITVKNANCLQGADLERGGARPSFQNLESELDVGAAGERSDKHHNILGNFASGEREGCSQNEISETRMMEVEHPPNTIFEIPEERLYESVTGTKSEMLSEKATEILECREQSKCTLTLLENADSDYCTKLSRLSKSRTNSSLADCSHVFGAEINSEQKENHFNNRASVHFGVGCTDKDLCVTRSGPTTRLRSQNKPGNSNTAVKAKAKMAIQEDPPLRKRKRPKYVYKDSDDEGVYHCDIEGCSMNFHSKQELNVHKRNTCTYEGCSKQFSSHKYLMQHRRVHLDDRPFSCSWKGCKMTFKWAWAKTEHMRVHTGERPYICSVASCGKTFRFVSDFSRHRRKTGHK